MMLIKNVKNLKKVNNTLMNGVVKELKWKV